MKKIISAVLLGATLCFTNQAFAGIDSIYDVDVYVDISDESAALAKEKAMTEAHRTAFTTVADRVTNSEGVKVLQELDDDQILNFIKEVSITSEKASNVRYIANLKVTINEDIIKQYMAEKGITPAILTATKILVIPTFREFKTDTPMLWEAKNIWKKAWEEEAGKNNDIVKFITIPATGSNYASLDAKKAINLDEAAMKQIAFNNNTPTIFVVDAFYNGIEGLTINVISSSDERTESIEIYGDRSPQLLINSIIETKKSITDRLKNQVIEENTMKNEITGLYNYQSMSEWIKIEKAIKEIPSVDEVKITAMSNGTVQFKITFTGSFEKLSSEMAERYMSIEEDGDHFIVKKI